MITLNSFAEDMLNKACKKENGIIIVGKDAITNDYITINNEAYLINNTNYLLAEAFEQLKQNSFVVCKYSPYKIEYTVTLEGYNYIKSK